ncbi:MAG: hypothetical protein MJ245_07730 [Clostridia bacterium]|nr:hypothetical protein [Clostridia bacterium]
MSKYKNYIEVFVVLLVITCVILCFLPICNGSYLDYEALLQANPDEMDQDEANRIKEQYADPEDLNVVDSLEIQREISDVLNEFINDLKQGNYEDAYQLLDVPTYENEANSLKYMVEYNKGFSFFKTYLASFDLTINQVSVLDDTASVNVDIKRYDINRMINNLIREKKDEGIDLEKETYESILFEYENYLKEEFSKTNAYMRKTSCMITLRKLEDGTWKIQNDEDLNNNVIYLDVLLEKNLDELIKEYNESETTENAEVTESNLEA